MQLISLSALRDFWVRVPASEVPLRNWARIVKTAAWRTPADVKRAFNHADPLRDGRIIFDVGGNKYRIVTWIDYERQRVLVKFVGTHAEYDRIDAQEVER